MGLIYLEKGPLPDAVALLSRAQSLNDELGLRINAVFATLYLAFALLSAGDPARAVREFEAAAELATEMRHVEELADSYEGISFAYVALGRPEDACRYAERAFEVVGAVSSHQYEISALVTLGEALLCAGRIDEAMTNLLHALKLAEKLEFQLNVRRAELAVAAGYRELGQYELATQAAMSVLGSTYEPYHGQALTQLARIQLAQGDTAAAVESAAKGLEISRSCGYRVDEANALWVLGEARLAHGADADSCLRAATSMFEEIGNRNAVAKLEELRAAVRSRRGGSGSGVPGEVHG